MHSPSLASNQISLICPHLVFKCAFRGESGRRSDPPDVLSPPSLHLVMRERERREALLRHTTRGAASKIDHNNPFRKSDLFPCRACFRSCIHLFATQLSEGSRGRRRECVGRLAGQIRSPAVFAYAFGACVCVSLSSRSAVESCSRGVTRGVSSDMRTKAGDEREVHSEK